LYARIRVGMPGTPMPGSKPEFLTDPQIGDLVNFVRSLSSPEAQDRVEHKRQQLVARRSQGPLAGEITEAEWNRAAAVPVVVSPLWWRDYTEPALKVQALHDGQTLALRMAWQDTTRNTSTQRPEDFDDMAAVQFFRGSPEPFLGMGAPALAQAGEARKVDLWLWRASWHFPQVAGTNHLMDDYLFDMPLYRELLKGKGLPELLTARAAGNLHAHADAGQSASNLAAKGFGSVSFRPKTSQRVTATASYGDGRWTVVLRRPLQVGTEEGISLTAGEHCSIGFAIWEGEARDRNGQKLITIWHDLKLD
jgi:hypothetical protein